MPHALHVFAVVCALRSGPAAIGFAVTALAFWFGWGWWQPVLLSVTLFSLLLTALDWNVAFAGVIVNLAILILLGLGPRIAAAFSG